MNSILKLVVTCRLVRQVQQSIFPAIPTVPLHPISNRLACLSVRIMAQRSITSFFKVSPPKPVVKEEKVEDEEIKINGAEKVESPVKNGKLKTASKRPRLQSSESDSSPRKEEKSPTVSLDKKKKVKRQRIESSGSESDVSPKSECLSPEVKSPSSPSPVKSTVISPSPSPEKIPVIKVEKAKSPKTYASPKSKKKKPLTEPNSLKKSPSPKKIKKECSPEETKKKITKKAVKKQETELNSENKSIKEETEVKSETKDLVPEAEYNPAKAKYHPISDACWRSGQPVPYLALARTLELIEGTSARLKMVDILANYLRSVMLLTPEDLLPSVYMCLNQLAPSYESLELGIAETYLMKAIAQCTGRTLAQVRGAARAGGDLGAVAQSARAQQRTMFASPPLVLRRVFAALKEIAHMTGTASVNKKINKIQSLYVACRHSEAKYLIRSLEGKLRIGLAEQSLLQALAQATALSPHGQLDASRGMAPDEFKAVVESNALIIKSTYCACPSYDLVLPVLLQHGVAALPDHCRLQPGVPLKPMLAHPTKQVTHIFDRFEKEQFTCEWKYDGERAQIHVPGTTAPDFGAAAVFSRNQENNTSKYPDVLRRLPSLLKTSVTSCVLDCEAVAYDVATKQILPFQVLSTRKRKDAVEADIKVQVCVFVFDLLYLNGESYVHRPLHERRAALREHLNEQEGTWQFATSRDCRTVEEVQQFMDEAMRGSCEGLMVKALSGPNSRYDIARRSHNWLKLKKDYLEGVGDTIDVVVIGAYLGRGKRAGLYGGFLLACYEPDAEEFQALCKIGTGFSDDCLNTFTHTLKQHAIDAPKNYYRYEPSHAADVWLSASVVWEVRCADLSLSPAHRAAIGRVHPDKGISLRFPRFVRVREDKSPEQATSAQQIAHMYLAQDTVRNCNTADVHNDDFY